MPLTHRILPHSGELFAQEKDNWCWAASAVHVADCFAKAYEQCAIASSCLPVCAGTCEDMRCDSTHFLHDALKKISRFDGHLLRKISSATVIDRIGRGHPVGVRIGWDDDNGHFVLIVGYGYTSARKGGALHYVIFDPNPAVGLNALPAQRLESGLYQLRGRWTETIYTK